MHSVALVIIETSQRGKVAADFALPRFYLEIIVTENQLILVINDCLFCISKDEVVVERNQQAGLIGDRVGLEGTLGVRP
jgi:hypothetical protein